MRKDAEKNNKEESRRDSNVTISFVIAMIFILRIE